MHEYIDVADERHLEAIFVLVEKEINAPYVLDEETIMELDRHRAAYMSGKGKSYTLEESMEMVRKTLSARE